MSSRHVVTAGSQSDAEQSDTCRVPNCWEDALPVRVANQTKRVAVLCELHRRTFLGVSS